MPGFFEKRASKENTQYSIIRKLTAIRVSQYDELLIRGIDDAQFSDMRTLVHFMGCKILKVNHSSSERLIETQTNFTKTIEAFFSVKNKLSLVYFSAQLLQYYTIVCHREFNAGLNLQEFLEFLAKNVGEFGTVESNLFITEYQLIKIYNNLCLFNDSMNGKIAPFPNMEEKVSFLLVQLNMIKIQVSDSLRREAENIFLHYLVFAINYSCAKALELQYHMQKNTLGDEEKFDLTDSQKFFLIAARNSLETLGNLQKSEQAESEISFVSGAEFSLGRNNMLIKLPGIDLNTLKSHLTSLI